ncbi:INCENP protein [Naegleria gruberi]|uniref:INCENP protein n=1 Tax=Naegleria gruberi TaxID=5762 RepID=D2VCS0_NAEGR|nr:INCENP protein [Naegleria gruberi]EFC45357.1 INCENP protein [Naegleria gruberi]|eukprot:XP_002678101.1 INCENP protein [Naegleria gruberi]
MLKQLLGEIDGIGKSSMDGLHSLFESQMNDLTMRAQNYKEQITNTSSYFYATPSFKVGVKGQLNSNKKPFPFSFNSGSAKKTPLKSPPHLHKTPIGSPHSFRKQTPLGTRNFDQELNIQPHNVTISQSPLFKFKSPIAMTSGGNKKKRKSSSVSKRNMLSPPPMIDSNVELPKEIELYAPIPPLEFDKDLGIDKDDEMDTDSIKPIEPVLMSKKNSVMSVDMELGVVTALPQPESKQEMISSPPPPQTITLLQQFQEPQQLSYERPLQPVVIPPSTIFQLPKVKEEPISDEEEIVVKKNRQPKRKPKLIAVQQPNNNTTNANVSVSTVAQEPPKEPEVIVIDDAKSDVTEQLSCLLISEALKENEKNEQALEQSNIVPVHSFIVKQEIVDSPEVVNKTFNRTCLDEMNISMIQPIEEDRKQTEFSFLSKTKLFQDAHDESDDSILCFSASDDDLFEDDKEEHENDVCVKINFAPPPVVNIFERQQSVQIPNPFSNLKKTNSAEAVKVTSLQEKIKSLKSEPCIPSIHSMMQKADADRPSLELSEPPCTPTRTPSISGAIEKLGQLSIHNKIEVMFSPPEVQLSPPPFDSIPDFSSPKYSSLQHIKSEVATPRQVQSQDDNNALTPKNDMQLSTPPTTSNVKEPPTISQHGKYKPFTPKFMEPRPNPTASSEIPYEDPFATLRRDSIDIIDVDENEHKRKFTNKVSTESNDQKRLKLSETNRISISSVSSCSSISSFHSNASIGELSNPGVGNVVSNIFTGVKSFVFKVAQNKNKSSVGASKKAISSLKLAEAAKKKEEDKKNAKKEKLEKQLALQKKKKEQEDKLKEDAKKQTKLVKTNSSNNTSQKSIVEGLALASGSRSSNISTCSNSTNSQTNKKIIGPQIGPMNKPQPPKKQTTLTTKPLTAVPEPRVSSYDLSDEYDSSEDDEVAKRRRQHKKIPSWAQGETLKKNIIRTTKIDPDRIFGSVRTCNLEDIFKGTTNQVMINRFRQRTSSSNWTADHFTLEEEEEYREEMGFTL